MHNYIYISEPTQLQQATSVRWGMANWTAYLPAKRQ